MSTLSAAKHLSSKQANLQNTADRIHFIYCFSLIYSTLPVHSLAVQLLTIESTLAVQYCKFIIELFLNLAYIHILETHRFPIDFIQVIKIEIENTQECYLCL